VVDMHETEADDVASEAEPGAVVPTLPAIKQTRPRQEIPGVNVPCPRCATYCAGDCATDRDDSGGEEE